MGIKTFCFEIVNFLKIWFEFFYGFIKTNNSTFPDNTETIFV